jgi:hypothetical protein
MRYRANVGEGGHFKAGALLERFRWLLSLLFFILYLVPLLRLIPREYFYMFDTLMYVLEHEL